MSGERPASVPRLRRRRIAGSRPHATSNQPRGLARVRLSADDEFPGPSAEPSAVGTGLLSGLFPPSEVHEAATRIDETITAEAAGPRPGRVPEVVRRLQADFVRSKKLTLNRLSSMILSKERIYPR